MSEEKGEAQPLGEIPRAEGSSTSTCLSQAGDSSFSLGTVATMLDTGGVEVQPVWVWDQQWHPLPHLGGWQGHKALPKAAQGKLGGIPEFVAEVTIPQDPIYIQVDVST